MCAWGQNQVSSTSCLKVVLALGDFQLPSFGGMANSAMFGDNVKATNLFVGGSFATVKPTRGRLTTGVLPLVV